MRLLPPAWPRALRRIAAGALGLFVPSLGGGSRNQPARAYQPLVRSADSRRDPRGPKAGASLTNPIDRFVRAQLAQQHGAPSAAADPRTLIRRVSLDLTGLPPTPGGSRGVPRRVPLRGGEGKGEEETRSEAPMSASWIGCSPRRVTGNAGRDTGWTQRTLARPTATIRTGSAPMPWPYRDYLITLVQRGQTLTR
jgi:hypothetical protein